jgi:hypothetical protein
MSELDYIMESEFECPDSDVNAAAFVRVTGTIEGCSFVKEFLACRMYPLASGFGFRDVAIGTTTMSKVETPLPIFHEEAISAEGTDHFSVKLETDDENVLGSYRPREHDVLMTAKLPNGGCLN